MIYLDNASTSFPKAKGVAQAMSDYINNIGMSLHRSAGEASFGTELITLCLRERICRIFNFAPINHVVLTPGATYSLNMVIRGLLERDAHVIVSSLEHNAVMRPINQLKSMNISYSRIPSDSDGNMDYEAVRGLIRDNTKALIMTHASNVGGNIYDIKRISEICKKNSLPLILDASQSAGHIDIDFMELELSALIIPAHKGLLGPQGIGALLMKPEFAKKIRPIIAGGTGSLSDKEEIPIYMPDRFEAGTMNMPGIYGFEKALEYIENIGVDKIRQHILSLTEYFIDELEKIEGLDIIGERNPFHNIGIVSVDFKDKDNAFVSTILEREYGIITRCGLHCSPNSHISLGSFPRGSIRFSIGIFNTIKNIDAVIFAIKKILYKES